MKICHFSFPAPWIKSGAISTESKVNVKVNKQTTTKKVNSEKNVVSYILKY